MATNKQTKEKKMTPIKECSATVVMTLEQINSVKEAFSKAEELDKEVQCLTLQLAEAREDLSTICKNVLISRDGKNVWINNWDTLSAQEQENVVLIVKRYKDEN